MEGSTDITYLALILIMYATNSGTIPPGISPFECGDLRESATLFAMQLIHWQVGRVGWLPHLRLQFGALFA